MNDFFLDTALLSGRFRDVRITGDGRCLDREENRGCGRPGSALLLADGRFLKARSLPTVSVSRSRLAARLQGYLDSAIEKAPPSIASRRRRMRGSYRLLSSRIEKISQRHGAITGDEMGKVVLQIRDFLDSFADPRRCEILLDTVVWDQRRETLRVAKKSLAARWWRKLIERFDLGRRYYGRRAARSFTRALTAKYHVGNYRVGNGGNERHLLGEAFRRAQVDFAAAAQGRVSLSWEQALGIHRDLEAIDFSRLDRRRRIEAAVAGYAPETIGFRRVSQGRELPRNLAESLYLPYLRQRVADSLSRRSSGDLGTASLDALAAEVLEGLLALPADRLETIHRAVLRYRRSVTEMTDAFASQSMDTFFSAMPEMTAAARGVLDADPMASSTGDGRSWKFLTSLLESRVQGMSQGTVRHISQHLSSPSGQSVMFVLGSLASHHPSSPAASEGWMIDVGRHFITTLLESSECRLGHRHTLIRRKLTELEEWYKAGWRGRFHGERPEAELAERAARLFGRRVGDMVIQGRKGWTHALEGVRG